MEFQLKTDRLLLREISLEDAKDMYRMYTNPEVMQYTGETPVGSLEEMEEAIRVRIPDYKKYGYGRWATFLKDGMQFTGWYGLAYLPEFDEIDLGYRFFPEFWGKGIATESSRAVLQYGFEELGLARIVAIAMKENKASIRVMEKVGMEFEKLALYDPGGEDVVWYHCNKELFRRNQSHETL